jgi:competence protein ComEA
MARLGWGWILVIILVLAILAGGGVYLARRGASNPPLEISLPASSTPTIEVHIDGAVNDPGVYSLPGDTSLEQLLQVSGGLKDGAQDDHVEVHVPESGQISSTSPQKVNLNTAPDWLLEALPGVGPTLAQNIIEYRTEHPFQHISQLMQVESIGPATYDNLKDFVTVE